VACGVWRVVRPPPVKGTRRPWWCSGVRVCHHARVPCVSGDCDARRLARACRVRACATRNGLLRRRSCVSVSPPPASRRAVPLAVPTSVHATACLPQMGGTMRLGARVTVMRPRPDGKRSLAAGKGVCGVCKLALRDADVGVAALLTPVCVCVCVCVRRRGSCGDALALPRRRNTPPATYRAQTCTPTRAACGSATATGA